MKALLIAEKPSVLNQIKPIYDKLGHKDKIVFKSFLGHVMALQKPADYDARHAKWDLSILPIIPDNFKYSTSDDKKKLVKELNKEIKEGNYDYIINACDPDREGEAIFRLYYEANHIKLPVKRFWCNELMEEKIKKELDHLRDSKEYDNLGAAAKARGWFDWLVGMNGTMILTKKIGKLANVGRVMTPTLKFIVDREKAIRDFKTNPYWEVEATFVGYKGTYIKDDKIFKFTDREKANTISKYPGNIAQVIKVEKKTEKKYAPNLHSLQDLQNEAGKVYGYTLDQTLKIAQGLYEKAFLSYPRTDTGYIGKEVAESIAENIKAALAFAELEEKAKEILSDRSAIESFASNKRYVDNSKVGGHDAIRPTGKSFKLEQLSTEEKNIMYLVCRRLVAMFLGPQVSAKTEIITETDLGHSFKTKGSTLISKGFQEIYNIESKDTILPNVEEGQEVKIKEAQLIEKKTSPPERFTVANIGEAMEQAGKLIEDKELSEILKGKGLGTPATRAEVINKLTRLKMISLNKKAYMATEYGEFIIDTLGQSEVTKPELTAAWETKLEKLAEGEYSLEQFTREMKEFTKKIAEELKGLSIDKEQAPVSDEKVVLGKCPCCGKNVIAGKKYYLCEGYKKTCNFIISDTLLDAKITKTDIKALLEGKTTKEKTFKWKSGKSGPAKLKLESGQIKFEFK